MSTCTLVYFLLLSVSVSGLQSHIRKPAGKNTFHITMNCENGSCEKEPKVEENLPSSPQEFRRQHGEHYIKPSPWHKTLTQKDDHFYIQHDENHLVTADVIGEDDECTDPDTCEADAVADNVSKLIAESKSTHEYSSEIPELTEEQAEALDAASKANEEAIAKMQREVAEDARIAASSEEGVRVGRELAMQEFAAQREVIGSRILALENRIPYAATSEDLDSIVEHLNIIEPKLSALEQQIEYITSSLQELHNSRPTEEAAPTEPTQPVAEVPQPSPEVTQDVNQAPVSEEPVVTAEDSVVENVVGNSTLVKPSSEPVTTINNEQKSAANIEEAKVSADSSVVPTPVEGKNETPVVATPPTAPVPHEVSQAVVEPAANGTTANTTPSVDSAAGVVPAPVTASTAPAVGI